jgi:thiosulfate/3-mercaptopyruvate sulfurtransferase
VLVNALPFEAYSKETLPHSINCPYTATYADDNYPLLRSRHELGSLLAKFGLSPMRRTICFCGVGYTASQIYFSARLAGYDRVSLYDGSMVDWSARGGELVPGEPG